MKTFKKILAALVLGGSLITTAMAADVPSNTPNQQNLNVGDTHGTITVINDTYETYNVKATYYPTLSTSVMYLGPYGYSTDTIYYPLSFPNYKVCFDIDSTDWSAYHVYGGCVSSGIIYITNDVYGLKGADGKPKPVVKITK